MAGSYVHIDGEGDFDLMRCKDCLRWGAPVDEEGYVVEDKPGWCRLLCMRTEWYDFCSFEQVWDEVEDD